MELNNDVWHAFRRAYGARDTAAFVALYTPDLIRAGGPDQRVYGFDEFAAQTRQWFADLTERGSSIAIEFRFTERITGDATASERGYYRITATRADGDQRVFYGGFHTFARKADGRWRIAVDYDSTEDATTDDATTAADRFAAAAGIDDVERFAG